MSIGGFWESRRPILVGLGLIGPAHFQFSRLRSMSAISAAFSGLLRSVVSLSSHARVAAAACESVRARSRTVLGLGACGTMRSWNHAFLRLVADQVRSLVTEWFGGY